MLLAKNNMAVLGKSAEGAVAWLNFSANATAPSNLQKRAVSVNHVMPWNRNSYAEVYAEDAASRIIIMRLSWEKLLEGLIWDGLEGGQPHGI